MLSRLNLLLDTCTFLWLVNDDAQLSDAVKFQFQSELNNVYLSAISAWEITVKAGLGRLNLDRPPASYVPYYRELHQIESLALEESATTQLPKLPNLHKDPFDRMLICQAIHHGLILVTPDPLISGYPVRTLW